MKMNVCAILFCFLCLYEQLQLLKTVIFRLEFTYLSKKSPKINLKFFHYQILISVERSEKQLENKL